VTRHRQLVTAGAALAAALLPAAPSAFGAVTSNRCTGQVVAAEGSVKIVRRGLKHDSYDRRSYACWHHRQTAALGDRLFDPGAIVVRNLQISGRWVAYALVAGDGRPPAVSFYSIYVLDARSGHKTRVPATLSPSSTFDFRTGVRSVVLTPAGSVAWTIDKDPIITPTSSLPSGDFSLYTLPAGTRTPTLITSGTGLDPTSLAAAPGRIYWISDGATMSAALP
jgi:hypothetical protein